MSRFSIVAAGLVVATAGLAATPRPAPAQLRDGATVTCESGGRLVRCQAALSWRGARLVKQLSRAPCLQGETWGFERNAIWVNDGCRGVFEAGDPFANIGERVVCASAGGERAECPADTRFGVRLLQTVSTARCVEGRSWGTIRRAIWVDRGCRGEFEVGGPDSADVMSPPSRRFMCGSSTGARVTCPTGGRPLEVGLVRDLSDGRCRRGSNWGADDSLIWASRGCRAIFEVTYRRPESGAGNATRRISCGAADELEAACKVGGPVVAVRLVRDLSRGRCSDTRNWGRNADFVWTTRGCRGEFEVTYRDPNAGPRRRTRTLTCGTFTGARVECPTGGGVVAVGLARDLGDGECGEGSRWGYTDSVVWASRGCRGEFEVTYRTVAGDAGTERTRVLTCGATAGRLVSCAIGGSVVAVRMMRDLSEGRCRQGATWGHTAAHVWTTRGCRGQFRVTYREPA
jgi:hypothetical protein